MIRPGQYEPLSSSSNADFVPSRRGTLSKVKRRVVDPVIDLAYEIWSRCVSFVRVNAGLLLVAASQAFFALMNVAVKKLNSLDPPVPALELVCVRMGITYICCITYLLWRKVPDPFLGPKGVRHLLAIRGFSGFFGLFGVYYSLQYLSLSDATVLTFLSPLTTAVSGCIFLGEVFSRKEAAAGVLSLLGVILIARPEAIFGRSVAETSDSSEKIVTSGQRLGAVGVALLGVLGSTGAYTSLRAIGKRAHTLHSMSYFSLWCVITSTAGMLILHEKFIFPTRIEWLALLVMIGIFGFLAQALLTMGLQRETAGRGALAIYVQIIYATILERIFFHTVPPALSITGTLIIMGSAVYVALTKQTTQSSEPKTNDSSSEGDVAFDLELGVAEPERQHFLPLAHDNTSRISLFQRQESWKAAAGDDSESTMTESKQLQGLATGMGGSKSEVSLVAPSTVLVPPQGEAGREKVVEGGEEEEEEEEEEETLVEALGFSPTSRSDARSRTESGERIEDEDGSIMFDAGEVGINSDVNEYGDNGGYDDHVDEDRRRLLRRGEE